MSYYAYKKQISESSPELCKTYSVLELMGKDVQGHFCHLANKIQI